MIFSQFKIFATSTFRFFCIIMQASKIRNVYRNHLTKYNLLVNDKAISMLLCTFNEGNLHFGFKKIANKVSMSTRASRVIVISKKHNITHLYILLKSYKTVTPQWTRADERDQLLILASRKLASDELPRTRRAHYLPQSVTPQSAINTHTLSQRNISNYSNQFLLQQCTHQLAKTWWPRSAIPTILYVNMD